MMAIELLHLRAEFLAHVTGKELKENLEHALSHAQQLLHSRIADQRLQSARFLARYALAPRCEAEIASPLIRLARFGRHCFDQAVGEHPSQGSIEIAGQNGFASELF